MSNLNDESNFFHGIAPSVIALVRNSGKEVTVAENKGVGDYSTQVDVNTENLIVSELAKHFPHDQILAEEGHSDTPLGNNRTWLIDPICGTNNLGKGISNFCTNIALIDGDQVIAACVVDHSHGEYLWSVGDNQVFINDTPYQPPAPELGFKIDIDFGSVRAATSKVRQRHSATLLKLINDTAYDVISLNTSLGFAYTAIGKTDGFINVFNHPWDIAAAAFLVQQVGGIITGIDGAPWTVSTVGAIGGRTPEIHQELLRLFLDS